MPNGHSFIYMSIYNHLSNHQHIFDMISMYNISISDDEDFEIFNAHLPSNKSSIISLTPWAPWAPLLSPLVQACWASL